MDFKRYRPDAPELGGRPVVLASDFDQVRMDLTNSEAIAESLKQELAATRQLHTALDTNASLSDRMKAAGMLTVEKIMAGSALDAFIRHAGVNSFDTYNEWLGMKRAEYVRLHARLVLEKREDDELFDWALAHAAVFGEALVNFTTAYRMSGVGTLPPASETKIH
jgi:hypothetical protein